MLGDLFQTIWGKAKQVVAERFNEEVKHIGLRYNNEKKRGELVLYVYDLRLSEEKKEVLRGQYRDWGLAVVFEQAPPES
jgi:hypothetical protein